MPEIDVLNSDDQRRTVQSEMRKQMRKLAQDETKKIMSQSIEEESDDDDHFIEFDGDDDLTDIDDTNDEDDLSMESGTTSGTSEEPTDEMKKMLKEIEKRDAFDIFTDVGDEWMRNGEVVRYAVIRNGKRLTAIDHPLTWEDLQTKFGGGNYKIEARLPALANRYLKSQTKYLGSPVNDTASREYPTAIKKAEAEQKSSMEEVLKLMEVQAQKENERRRYEDERAERLRVETETKLREAREEAKREAQEKLSSQERLLEKMMEMNRPKENNSNMLREMTPIITALAPILLKKEEPKDNSKEIFDMMMKMQEMTNKQIENMNKNFEKQVGSLAESIKEIAKAGSGNNKKELDAFALLEMSQKSEARAFEKFTLMNELASEKAREIAELKEEASPSFDKESSTFDKLLTTLGPAIASSLLSPRSGGVTAPTVQAQPVPQPVRAIPAPQHRGSVRSPSTINQPVRRTIVEERVARNQVQTIAKTENERTIEQSSARVIPIQRTHSVGPSVLDALHTEEETNALSSFVPTDYSRHVENISQGKDLGNLEKIKETIFPIALESFLSNDGTNTLDSVAERSVNALIENGIDLTTVQRDFDDNALSDILNDVPEDTHEVIKGLRSEILIKIEKSLSI